MRKLSKETSRSGTRNEEISQACNIIIEDWVSQISKEWDGHVSKTNQNRFMKIVIYYIHKEGEGNQFIGIGTKQAEMKCLFIVVCTYLPSRFFPTLFTTKVNVVVGLHKYIHKHKTYEPYI